MGPCSCRAELLLSGRFGPAGAAAVAADAVALLAACELRAM
jgi:hypothetical protein